MKKAFDKYTEFHDFAPKKVGEFDRSLKIPAYVTHVGRAKWVAYHSDKWGKQESYIHDHKDGVKMYMPGRGSGHPVPLWIRNTKHLVRLGKCLGYAYDTGDDELEHDPIGELFCTPNGKCLLIIAGKKRLVAMVWGGKLGVEDRGIVG